MSRARLNKNIRRKGAFERRQASMADCKDKIGQFEGLYKEICMERQAKANSDVKNLKAKVSN